MYAPPHANVALHTYIVMRGTISCGRFQGVRRGNGCDRLEMNRVCNPTGHAHGPTQHGATTCTQIKSLAGNAAVVFLIVLRWGSHADDAGNQPMVLP